MEPVNYYVGIDVGTASVRAALVDQFGTVVVYADQPIQMWAPQPDHYEQSSDDIWTACCTVTKKVIQGIDIGQIRGIGFDATCSLVVLDNNFHPLAVNRDGNEVLPPGAPVGNGLSPDAANDLGLPSGIAVAASLIDAHAGGIGMIGASVKGYNLPCENQPITSRIAVICGTSSCHMGISDSPVFVPGVWGPYYSAMVPGFWLNEGGQSATGKLVEHVVQGHTAFPELQTKAAASAQSIYMYLNGHLDLIKKSLPVGFLTVDVHVWPDFHGNRSPLADLTLKGMVVGLTLSRGLDDLAVLYLATIQAIALGTRHIVETMQTAGHHVNTLFMCGGLSKNPLFVQMHADIMGMPIVLAKEVESVLMGAAILGACASKDFTSLQDAMEKMGRVGKIVLPNHKDKRFYDKKYQVFLKLVEHQQQYKTIMQST
uniref:FGGY carbohydrate kinase domain-containing protein isoform X4 n=1 Tax=Euleptes europaea TaxID=460621 RepID=UPI0025410BDC|nr:FGGY carbohydrate kinase domain-containing protein isoform X4 [Euleptes europaea]